MPLPFQSEPVFRPITAHEQPLALRLWSDVFGRDDSYFGRYYAADPWYQDGDSLGAWVGGTLASAVHLCRRPVEWEGGTLLCGGIANVATRPEHRGRGLSRRLLTLAIERMEAIGCDYSTLGTGIAPFYAALGWELINLPRLALTRREPDFPAAVSDSVAPARPTPEIAALYAHAPRPLQQPRPGPYFERWVGWDWRSSEAQIVTQPGGYAVLTPADPDSPDPADHLPSVSEWRAADAAAERDLLRAALAHPLFSDHPRLLFAALPQFAGLDVLEQFGSVEQTASSGQMIRRVGLAESEFARVQAAYAGGQAACWPADGF